MHNSWPSEIAQARRFDLVFFVVKIGAKKAKLKKATLSSSVYICRFVGKAHQQTKRGY
jgi:hypothetical protein